MNVTEYCSLIKENESLFNKDGKIESNILKTSLSLVQDAKVKQAITEALISEGIVQLKKGEASYSQVQRKIVHYLNHQFHVDLFENGKTSFALSDEEIESSLREEDKKVMVLNANGHLIEQKVNNTDVTEKRRVEELKSKMENSSPKK